MNAEPERLADRADLDRLVAGGGDLFVDFSDASSGTSRAFSQALETALRGRPGTRLARAVLADVAPVAALFGIREAPALVVFRVGVGLFAGPAPAPGAALDGLLRRVLALDMDQVRRDMDRERADLHTAAGVRPCPTRGRGTAS